MRRVVAEIGGEIPIAQAVIAAEGDESRPVAARRLRKVTAISLPPAARVSHAGGPGCMSSSSRPARLLPGD